MRPQSETGVPLSAVAISDPAAGPPTTGTLDPPFLSSGGVPFGALPVVHYQ